MLCGDFSIFVQISLKNREQECFQLYNLEI